MSFKIESELNWYYNPPVQKWPDESGQEITISFFRLLGKCGITIYYADFPMEEFHKYVKRMRRAAKQNSRTRQRVCRPNIKLQR